jgi:hypothetical protein
VLINGQERLHQLTRPTLSTDDMVADDEMDEAESSEIEGTIDGSGLEQRPELDLVGGVDGQHFEGNLLTQVATNVQNEHFAQQQQKPPHSSNRTDTLDMPLREDNESQMMVDRSDCAPAVFPVPVIDSVAVQPMVTGLEQQPTVQELSDVDEGRSEFAALESKPASDHAESKVEMGIIENFKLETWRDPPNVDGGNLRNGDYNDNDEEESESSDSVRSHPGDEISCPISVTSSPQSSVGMRSAAKSVNSDKQKENVVTTPPKELAVTPSTPVSRRDPRVSRKVITAKRILSTPVAASPPVPKPLASSSVRCRRTSMRH